MVSTTIDRSGTLARLAHIFTLYRHPESVSSAPSIDPEDPMRDYLLQQRKEQKVKSKSSKKRKHEGETPEERRARKEKKRAKKEAKARGMEDVAQRPRIEDRQRRRSPSRTPPRRSTPRTSPMRARAEHAEIPRESEPRVRGREWGEQGRDGAGRDDRHRDADQYRDRERERHGGRDRGHVRDKESSRDYLRHNERRANSSSPRRDR